MLMKLTPARVVKDAWRPLSLGIVVFTLSPCSLVFESPTLFLSLFLPLSLNLCLSSLSLSLSLAIIKHLISYRPIFFPFFLFSFRQIPNSLSSLSLSLSLSLSCHTLAVGQTSCWVGSDHKIKIWDEKIFLLKTKQEKEDAINWLHRRWFKLSSHRT